MQELIVKTTRPIIEANFEAVKQQLIDGLKTYDVIITAETVKDGKTMASEINKIKKAIKDQEKKALEDILGPGNEFKEKIKELLDLAEEAREKITTQVAAYEEKTKNEIALKIQAFSEDALHKSELREPFKKIEFLDLVKLTAITKTGNLTTATINAITGRVAEQKNLQLEDDARIAQEKKDKEDEIARIREEERIKAEQNIKVQVTIDPQPQQATQQAYEPGQEFTEQVVQQMEHIPEEYACAGVIEDSYPPIDYNQDTGEVYQDDTPAYMEEQQQVSNPKTALVTVEFFADISEVPNITSDQIAGAVAARLEKAGAKNYTIKSIVFN